MGDEQRPTQQQGIDQTNPDRQPGEEPRTPAKQQDQKRGTRQQADVVPGETLPRTDAQLSSAGSGDMLDDSVLPPDQRPTEKRVDPLGGDSGAQS